MEVLRSTARRRYNLDGIEKLNLRLASGVRGVPDREYPKRWGGVSVP